MGISDSLDRYYEFDREPVGQDKLQSASRFVALFGGEHVAATEFVIGAMFVLHGVEAADLLWGLLVGNALAVLMWALICAPIAVRTRLTLYWYLRKIGGPWLTGLYNLLNGFLYCVLAGAMISVSATAVGLAFGTPTPGLGDVYPNSVSWVLIVLVVGSVVTALAVLGFEKLAKFSGLCVPWMFAVFVAGAVALLPALGEITGLSGLWEIATQKIWTGEVIAGQEKFGFWHICFFAWFCNLSMHVGLSDMATLRYAKKWTYGFLSAFGMYPGHLVAWVCSGVMVAAVARDMDPGLMAYTAAGPAGAAAVLIAGWTTANPIMYRAGLALQAVTPNWPRWKVTIAAGITVTVLALFPVFFLSLLEFVALCGLLLMPVGAIVFADHWLLRWLGLKPMRAERLGLRVNVPALISWAGGLVIVFLIPIHLYFKWLPCWFITVGLYLALVWVAERRLGPSPSDMVNERGGGR